MSIRLRELIKKIREASTVSEERKIVAEESASIRDCMKSKPEYRLICTLNYYLKICISDYK